MRSRDDALWPVVAAVLACFFGIAAALPVLPGAVASTGAGEAALGVVLGAAPAAALVGRFVGGRLCDRRGRTTALQLGLAGSVVGSLLLALPVSVPLLLAARLVAGLADAVVYVAAAALVIERTDERRRPQALALLGTGVWGGYAVGPLVGGLLGDIRPTGVVAAVAAALGLALVAGLPEPARQGEPARGLRGFLPRGTTWPGIGLGLGNVGYAAVVGFLVLHVERRGGNGAVVLATFSAAVVVGRLGVVPLAVRLGLLRVLPVGLVAMAAGLLALTQLDGTWAPAAAVAVIGFGYCLPFPALATLVSTRVPAGQRGAAVGALTAWYDVFVGVASVALGLLAERRSTSAVFVAAAAAVLLAAVVDAAVARGAAAERRAAAEAEADEPPPDA